MLLTRRTKASFSCSSILHHFNKSLFIHQTTSTKLFINPKDSNFELKNSNCNHGSSSIYQLNPKNSIFEQNPQISNHGSSSINQLNPKDSIFEQNPQISSHGSSLIHQLNPKDSFFDQNPQISSHRSSLIHQLNPKDSIFEQKTSISNHGSSSIHQLNSKDSNFNPNSSIFNHGLSLIHQLNPKNSNFNPKPPILNHGFSLICKRDYHDGRPRGPLWKSKKLIGKEALFVILGLKRFKDDELLLDKFIKNHVLRLLKLDLIAVLTELERQEEDALALKVFRVIQKQDWYKPDTYLYKDLIISLSHCKKMDTVMQLWADMKSENLFPDSQTYTEVIRGFLRDGSPADAMNIYEDMLKSPDPPDELPFRILMKGLLPHPILRNKVKKDFEEIFPERSVYDPPQEIFGMF